MSKQVTEKIRAVYTFLTDKNKELVLSGGIAVPICYGISFDEKNEVSVLPIPLADLQSPEERRILMREMGKILKKEKVKIKMFMLTMEAWMSKLPLDKAVSPYISRPSEDPNRIEALVFSGRDCFENTNHQIYEIKRKENKKTTLELLPKGSTDWKKMGIKKNDRQMRDTLLDEIWAEYRSIK